MLQVDPIQSYLNLKIGLPPVLKAGSSGKIIPDPLRGSIGKVDRPKVKFIDIYKRFYEKIASNNFQNNIFLRLNPSKAHSFEIKAQD